MKVDRVAISTLVLDPANARKHAAKNLEAIKGSLAKFGQQKPIVVTPKGVVLAGNGTLEAARALGWDKIDCVRTKLEGTDATAYAIADNRSGELAEWDAGALSETLKSLQDLDFDLGSIGFDDADLANLIETPELTPDVEDAEPETAPDAADELPENIEERAKDGQVWQLGAHTLHVGDCLPALRKMAPDSVHALVTDPPAGIAFMGKEWDEDKGGRDQWVAWMTSVMRECLRVLKPGAHGLVWALPRTAHWTATALEDAGFEVRDCVTHLFGTGFPKSHAVDKGIDRLLGAERERKEVAVAKYGSMNSFKVAHGGQSSHHMAEKYQDRKPGETVLVNGDEPATDAAKQWQGWGTALKPACEFWWLVRKPISEKTVAANVLRWGTGGLNIDGCRIGTEQIEQGRKGRTSDMANGLTLSRFGGQDYDKPDATGRFPANLVLDEEAAAALDEQSGYSESKPGVRRNNNVGWKCSSPPKDMPSSHADSGGASRFFYVAKASRSDRGIGNVHPTVKPVALMEWMLRLVATPAGTVLDPFNGSGTTGLACLRQGLGFTGCEQSPQYADITLARWEMAAGKTASLKTVGD